MPVVRGAQVPDVSEVVDDVFYEKKHSLPVAFTTKPRSRQVPAGVIYDRRRGLGVASDGRKEERRQFLLAGNKKIYPLREV